MQRYIVSQFDTDTFVVVDQKEEREICVCGNYGTFEDAAQRALAIAVLLNQAEVAAKP